jgi:protein-tyrosine phosphatase
MEPAAAAELRRLGGDPSRFRARDLETADCESADLILTATGEQRSVVLEGCPRALRRTFTLLEFSHLVTEVEPVRRWAGRPSAIVAAASSARGAARLLDYDAADPYGQPAQVHRAVADLIGAAVDGVAASLTGAREPERAGP